MIAAYPGMAQGTPATTLEDVISLSDDRSVVIANKMVRLTYNNGYSYNPTILVKDLYCKKY